MIRAATGRVAGLASFAAPSLEAIDRRRLQLWLLTVVVLSCFSAAFVLALSGVELRLPSWLPPRALPGGLFLLVLLFCAYALEKELALRRLAALLVEERVLTAALTGRVGELGALLEATRTLHLDLDLQQVLGSILECAADLLAARDTSIMLLTGEELRTVATSGESMAGGARVALGEGIAGRVAATREAVLVEGRLESLGPRLPGIPPPQSAMCAPLIHRDQVLGVLNVNAPDGRTYSDHELRALSLFAAQATTAIANARLLEAQRLSATQGAFRAMHDSLTNLPNRALFLDRLRHAFARRRGPGANIALVLLDLKEFKRVNDSFGHPVGDGVLREVADRLRSRTRAGDTLARMGGDEFALLLESVNSVEEARQICDRVLGALGDPFRVRDCVVELSGSVGVALEGPAGGSLDELLDHADAALRASHGGAGLVVYEESLLPGLAVGSDLKTDLARALEQGQLIVHYQPIVALAERRIVAFEALLRWQHPTRGLLAADSFIGEADQAGLLHGIDLWTLDRACAFASELGDGATSLRVHVNVLPTGLHDPEILERVAAALETSGLAPHRLILEITEKHLLSDIEAASSRLAALRALGVGLALDDFGSGYSSLAYLRSFPVSLVKVDRLFIQGLPSDRQAAALVAAIVRFALGLGLEVVAEGIETEAQLASLLELGCPGGQGFLLCTPLPPAELRAFLARDPGA
ncbi:MAG: putative bifunctional diguanylate cyclase/phosphodiesterase [Thermoanaerobaculia bacterium]